MGTLNARLCFRRDPRGGDVAPPQLQPGNALTRFSHIVLLVHGYNNDEREAQTAYRGFDRLQRELARIPEQQPVAGGRVVEVYWPGDSRWGIASFLYYMASIAKAVETAGVLAAALRAAANERGFIDVDIVAHSTGCRLALETVKRLETAPNLRVRRVVFMAAAVATEMLKEVPDNHGLRRAYDLVVTEGAISLYSPADLVLAVAFPLGQTLTPGDEGFMPTALGHELWAGADVPLNLRYRQSENRAAGHSDYWGWRQETRMEQGRFASERIRDFVGLGAIASRGGPGRLIVRRAGAAGRQTPEAAGPAAREVG